MLPTSLHTAAGLGVAGATWRHNQVELSSTPGRAGLPALAAMAGLPAPQLQFTEWAWQLLPRLHLHLLDRTDTEGAGLLAGDPALLASLLDYDLSAQLEGVVAGAVGGAGPPSYLCLATTQLGHSLPELLERGLPLLRAVGETSPVRPALALLCNIVPLFLSDPASVTSLVGVVGTVLGRDTTVLARARAALPGSLPGPGPATTLAAAMLDTQLSRPARYGLTSAAPLVRLWWKLLTTLPDWTASSPATRLLDTLCRAAFLGTQSHTSSASVHIELASFTRVSLLMLTTAVCDRCAEPELRDEAARLAAAEQEKLQGGAGPGFISWITGAGAGTKLVFPTSSPACPWLAFFLLEVSPYQLFTRCKTPLRIIRRLYFFLLAK